MLVLFLAVAPVEGASSPGARDAIAPDDGMAEAVPTLRVERGPDAAPASSMQAAPELSAAGEAAHRHRYFFHGFDYGSQASFNPLSNLLNRSFDVLQLRGDERNPFTSLHARDFRNVLDNLAHPYARIRTEGGWRFIREELLPLSWGVGDMRWGPNYSLHLIGGGMTYTALREWYAEHGVPLAGLLSAMTVMSSAFINEALENKGSVGRNTDCIADIYFFDLGGILLFSSASINRFFSEVVVVSDWSTQPGLTWPGTALNNQSNNFAFKWSLPFHPALRLFAFMGMSTLAGLSYRLPSGISWSLGAGSRATRLVNRAQAALRNSAEFAASAGLFVDRDESLLASLLVSDVHDYFVSFNLYPNALVRFEPGLGLWTAVSKGGDVVVGLAAVRSFGLGVGLGSVYR